MRGDHGLRHHTTEANHAERSTNAGRDILDALLAVWPRPRARAGSEKALRPARRVPRGGLRNRGATTADVSRGGEVEPPAGAEHLSGRPRGLGQHIVRGERELRRPAETGELAERLGLHPNGVRIHLSSTSWLPSTTSRFAPTGASRASSPTWRRSSMNACPSAGDNRRRCLGESPLDGGLDENPPSRAAARHEPSFHAADGDLCPYRARRTRVRLVLPSTEH
jgi:hypothetical protein